MRDSLRDETTVGFKTTARLVDRAIARRFCRLPGFNVYIYTSDKRDTNTVPHANFVSVENRQSPEFSYPPLRSID